MTAGSYPPCWVSGRPWRIWIGLEIGVRFRPVGMGDPRGVASAGSSSSSSSAARIHMSLFFPVAGALMVGFGSFVSSSDRF